MLNFNTNLIGKIVFLITKDARSWSSGLLNRKCSQSFEGCHLLDGALCGCVHESVPRNGRGQSKSCESEGGSKWARPPSLFGHHDISHYLQILRIQCGHDEYAQSWRHFSAHGHVVLYLSQPRRLPRPPPVPRLAKESDLTRQCRDPLTPRRGSSRVRGGVQFWAPPFSFVGWRRLRSARIS